MPTLRWLTRDEDVGATGQVGYRLLEEVAEVGYGDLESGNMLVQGDNLAGLKALLPYFAGRVKCIYIDPPYNTGSAFKHYDDNLEHSKWLAMMWPRLELLRELLAEDGSIWVSIDDREGHYLKVIMDEIFGRGNFVANVVWQSKDTPGNNASTIAETHTHNLIFKHSDLWKPNLLERTKKQMQNYKNPDKDPRGPWLGTPLTRAEHRDRDFYGIKNDAGREIFPPTGSSWRRPPETLKKLLDERRVYWGKSGDSNFPMEKKYLSEVKGGVTPQTWWPYQDFGSTRNAGAELKALSGGERNFDTPKPEKLVEQVFHIATNPGDLVLDSFLGSGTTAAVAHKMGRRYIGIEMGDHAVSHCAPRLRKVIDGEQGGISKAHNWKGGGGFRFFRLGPPVFDADGRIRPDIRFATLAAHVWFAETGHPWTAPEPPGPFLGAHDGRGYALLYNGVLGDRSVGGGNVLTRKTLAAIRAAQGDFTGPLTVYAARTALSDATLRAEGIDFRQTPYDIKARR